MNDLQAVRASDMCIGCGACVNADPSIELVLDVEKQFYEPSHDGGAAAASVCPAIAVDFERLQGHLFPDREITEYGVVDSVSLAQSTDLDRNVRASSGGLIKEMLRALLSRDDVFGAVALSEVSGLSYHPTLLTDASQVDELPGSIYHSLPKDGVVPLIRAADGPVVVVGIPCELEGLFNYVTILEPVLEAKIHSTIGLLCGWQYSHHAVRAIAEFKGVDFDQIQHISYRGGGPVGKLVMETPTSSHSVSRRIDFSYQVAFDRSFNTPRCHVCINHSNYLADVVVGDAWLPSTVSTRTGISLVVSRTPEMTALLNDLHERGRVALAPATTEEIRMSQKDRVIFGDFAYAYSDLRQSLGLHTPKMVGPNRAHANLADNEDVSRFHDELTVKLALQRKAKYRSLWLRKLTREFPSLFRRYWEWFAVRILRVESLKGNRKEIPRSELAGFK